MKKKKITKDTFRKIPSIDFKYEINPYGVIRNVKSKKLISHWIDRDGYSAVNLYTKNKRKFLRVHRLVGEVFLDTTNIDITKLVINHKDENKSNNYYKNLEWVTVAYNNSYGSRPSSVSKSHSDKYDDIIMVETGEKFPNSRAAAEYICSKTGKTNIETISRNIRNGAKENKWRYGSKWKRIPKQESEE